MSLRDQISGLERSLDSLEHMLAVAIEVEKEENSGEVALLYERIARLEAAVEQAQAPKGSVDARLTAIENTLERIAAGFGVAPAPVPVDPAPAVPNVVESLERLQSSLRQLQQVAQPIAAPKSARRA